MSDFHPDSKPFKRMHYPYEVVNPLARAPVPALPKQLQKKPRRVSFNAAVRNDLLKKYDNRCYYCSVELTLIQTTVDHFIPREYWMTYSQKREGWNQINNLRPACSTCNHLKGGTHPNAFIPLKPHPTYKRIGADTIIPAAVAVSPTTIELQEIIIQDCVTLNKRAYVITIKTLFALLNKFFVNSGIEPPLMTLKEATEQFKKLKIGREIAADQKVKEISLIDKTETGEVVWKVLWNEKLPSYKSYVKANGLTDFSNI